MTAPAPHDNADRLAALRRYGILDTPPEEAFDEITRLLAHVCRAPVAVINFIDEARQWFKSEIGLGVRETPLDISFCAHAILQPGLFIVPDATQDERFACNPLVTSDPHLRFYAGALLETSDGFALGTICVLDTVPRDLDGPQKDALRTLARQVMSQLELRRELAAQARVRDELRRASEAAERANAAKDRFLATLSHELRTPLSPVLLAAAEWATNRDLPEALRDDLAMIHRNVELETRLIDDLLDLTRIVSGKLRLHPEPVRVHPLLTSVLDICAGDIFDKDLHVECDLRAADDRIIADPARLQQVLWNLIKNATKFTPDGGRIRVVTSDDGRGRLRIEVRDSGVGIPPDALPRVFEAFEQGGAEVTQRHGGLGLGLAISRAVVDLHGGTIRAESEGTGRGASFIVELPASRASVEPLASSGPSPGGHERRSGLRILLVEDHADTAKLLGRLLGRMGYVVLTAGTVARALDLAEAEPFDLVISDVGLPDASGYDLMRQIGQKHGISGIALSGYGMEGDLREAREAGFAEHLIKPVTVEMLDQAIRRIVPTLEGATSPGTEPDSSKGPW